MIVFKFFPALRPLSASLIMTSICAFWQISEMLCDDLEAVLHHIQRNDKYGAFMKPARKGTVMPNSTEQFPFLLFKSAIQFRSACPGISRL